MLNTPTVVPESDRLNSVLLRLERVTAAAEAATAILAAPSDYARGRAKYFAGRRFSDCRNDAERDGWAVAADEGCDSFWLAMMQAAQR